MKQVQKFLKAFDILLKMETQETMLNELITRNVIVDECF